MTKKALCLILTTVLTLSVTSMAAWAMDTCIYCGSTRYGQCSNSPCGVHVHNKGDAYCIFCSSTSYGKDCFYSPIGIHVHGHGRNKCVYCGSTNQGKSCFYSPNGFHER